MSEITLSSWVETYLRPGITKESLTTTMMEKTHLQAAKEKQETKKKLFDTIRLEMLQ
jgi:hypothetical protein